MISGRWKVRWAKMVLEYSQAGLRDYLTYADILRFCFLLLLHFPCHVCTRPSLLPQVSEAKLQRGC